MSAALLVALFFLLQLIILRHIFRMPVVNMGVVVGALCVYVLLGLMFANLYLVVQAATGDAFFTSGHGTQSDFLYFSYVTETTTGYGDFIAKGDLGRTLAVTEAMMGQVLLVTLVARFVSTLGMRRSDIAAGIAQDPEGRPGSAPAETDGTD